MRRAIIALFVLSLAAFAANIKLYLKDGGFHLVREYQVETDRVRYYSVERSQWEEMPLDLVDLKRTESEMADRKAQLAEENKVVAEEEQAVREARAEVAKIPRDPGVYYVEDSAVKPIKVAESKMHNYKGRTVLQVISPIPVVTGKSTLELDGIHSQNIFTNPGAGVLYPAGERRALRNREAHTGEGRAHRGEDHTCAGEQGNRRRAYRGAGLPQADDAGRAEQTLADEAHGAWRIRGGGIHAG